MYSIRVTKQYHKSYKKIKKSGEFVLNKLNLVIDSIANEKQLSARYKDHALKGVYLGYRECHIEPDLLLVYQIHKNLLILVLVDIGSHSDIFG